MGSEYLFQLLLSSGRKDKIGIDLLKNKLEHVLRINLFILESVAINEAI